MSTQVSAAPQSPPGSPRTHEREREAIAARAEHRNQPDHETNPSHAEDHKHNPRDFSQSKKTKFLALGDSISLGFNPDIANTDQGISSYGDRQASKNKYVPYVLFLGNYLGHDKVDLVTVIGRRMYTAEQLLNMLCGVGDEVDPESVGTYDVIMVMAGMNDVARGLPYTLIYRNLICLYEHCEKNVDFLVGMTIPQSAHDESRFAITELRKQVNAFIRDYFSKLDREKGCLFDVEAYLPFNKKTVNQGLWASDGVHFSEAGYERMAKGLADVLKAKYFKESRGIKGLFSRK